MIEYSFPVLGQQIPVRVPQAVEDFQAFQRYIIDRANAGERVAYDTETTGLATYSRDFRIRTAQFGTPNQAWVLQVEKGSDLQRLSSWALRTLPALSMQNRNFDMLASDRHLPGITLEKLAPKTLDTYIHLHLSDPRRRDQGGIGNGLKDASAHYVDPSAPDTAAGLYDEFHKIGHTKDTGWRHIDIDNPLYLSYAGGDVILTSRLLPKVQARVAELGINPSLIPFEHEVGYVCALIERRGMRIDREYTTRLSAELSDESARWAEEARKYGVENINSTRQVSAALLGMGEEIKERTAGGAVQVDGNVLKRLADVDRQWDPIGSRTPNPLAMAILRSKRASKWRTSYADAMLRTADENDRVHPKIGALAARTARMSISDPPFQQLPSGKWEVRRAVIADEGHRMISVDYSSVEPRVMAALSGDERMTAAILRGDDLHNLTAASVYGPDFVPAQRKVAKVVQLGVAYGGGAKTIAAQTGLTLPEAQAAVRGYKRTYPRLARYIRSLQAQVIRDGYTLRTPSGRRLVFDRDAAYASFNGEIQSTARDIFAQGLLEIHARGLTQHVLLPVHDEIIADATDNEAPDIAREIGEAMTMTLRGIPLGTDPDVGGASWGSLYMKTANTMIDNDPWYRANPEAAHIAERERG
ncbi:DNA polymerase [Streptomyces albipurpureus]|uniref:DNA polymerase I n=1 Tax=Streptomyces albipurpureus TaxID=2897419 RepID=A0ABT0UTN0_9ACTN|nr:DNA polymerase [Streptomyces sp. CWNU-1]MCM2391756.1 DNA polymerase [Streptomyces sp. CWNU-1]